jgi:hypothetical protein
MTGPEHYREAERLLRGATLPNGDINVGTIFQSQIEAAQVHATLAQAAATVEAANRAMGSGEYEAWREVGC